jgi:hypothetical protein
VGQEQTSTGAITGTVQIERKSISELPTARIGARRLRLGERGELVGPSLLEV